MKLLRFFSDYWHFSRKYSQFERIFELTQAVLSQNHSMSDDSKENILLINRRVIDIKNEIKNLNLSSLMTCADCKGKCCQGSAEHYFTAIDFWTTKFSSGNSINYAFTSKKTLYYYISKRLRNLACLFKDNDNVNNTTNGCFYLGINGCRLDHVDRPIKCLVATCPELRRSLDKRVRGHYIELINKLFIQSEKVFETMKKEAGLPKWYGRLSLLLAP